MPLQIGCSVVDDSKFKMYSFYYDCIDKYTDRSNYQYIEMDCNSAYMALAGEFENLIRPKLKNQYENDKVNWFILNNYDKRTPGLFKIEFKGVGAITLCSKSYYVWSEDKFKSSSEGVQKFRAMYNKEHYFKCLNLKQQINCTNIGFRKHNGQIKTYTQNKIGLTPIYTAGVVLNNGVNVAPFNL